MLGFSIPGAERNWRMELLWRLRYGSRAIILGRVQAELSRQATVNVNQARIGIRVLGTATGRSATTILAAGAKARLELAGAIIGRGAVVSVGPGGELVIGPESYLNDGSRVMATRSIRVGSRCAISWGVTVIDDDGHGFGSPPYSAPVMIEDDVWIGCNTTILKGVTIGAGSAIGAGSVVTRSCPPRSLIAGVPARVIKSDIQWTDAARGCGR